MTAQEFSNEFDVLLNSYANQSRFGDENSKVDLVLDEYEKSVFLTRAQENIVLGYFTGKNSFGKGFEATEEIRRYLNSLIKTARLSLSNPSLDASVVVLNEHSYLAQLPNDLWFITYEAIKLPTNALNPCISEKVLEVVPVTQDDLHRVIKNPFKGASDDRVLRLDFDPTNQLVNRVELIFNDSITVGQGSNYPQYIIRYVSKLSPIVLVSLSGDDVSLSDNETSVSTCKLHPALHHPILEEAVRLALISKGIQYRK